MKFKTTLHDAVSRSDDILFDGTAVTNVVFPPDRPGYIRVETFGGDEHVHLLGSMEVEIDEDGDTHFDYTDDDGAAREAYMTFEERRPLRAP